MVSRTILALFSIAVIVAAVGASTPADIDDFEVDEVQERFIIGQLLKMKLIAASKIIRNVLETLTGRKNSEVDCTKQISDACTMNPVLRPLSYFWCVKKYILAHTVECFEAEAKKDKEEEKEKEKEQVRTEEKNEEKAEEQATKNPVEKVEDKVNEAQEKANEKANKAEEKAEEKSDQATEKAKNESKKLEDNDDESMKNSY